MEKCERVEKTKIRKLVADIPNSKNSKTPLTKATRTFSLFRLLLVTGVIFVIGITINDDQLKKDIFDYVQQQYFSFVYEDPAYCVKPYELRNLSLSLNRHIVGQEEALILLKQALRRHQRTTAIALIGGTGVGKSLTSRLIADEFPWPSNVRRHFWQLAQSQSSQADNLFALPMSSCGQNLLLIDDLLYENAEAVVEFTQKHTTEALTRGYRVILLFVINFPSAYTEEYETVHTEHTEHLSRLEGVETIWYRSLDQENLKECINREAKQMNIALSPTEKDELIRTIDVRKVGCKSIRAKVALFTHQ